MIFRLLIQDSYSLGSLSFVPFCIIFIFSRPANIYALRAGALRFHIGVIAVGYFERSVLHEAP